jgi:Ca-activated chloride channel homolog
LDGSRHYTRDERKEFIMAAHRRIQILSLLSTAFLLTSLSFQPDKGFAAGVRGPVRQGTLLQLDRNGSPVGECPLKHTTVRADVLGFLARVDVTQEFENKSGDKIEAVYTFPLPHLAAVDDMEMNVGGRIVRSVIRPREEARRMYEQARERGHVASLLDQERPNIFTQSVANIAPGAKVTIRISYLETLNYDDGIYEFVFPMVVGPRYIPGSAIGNQGGGWSPDTDRVPDASRITPPVAAPGTRAGHDIDIEVKLDAGLPIERLESSTHEVLTERVNPQQAVIRLKDQATLPNKDFILRIDVSRAKIQDGLFLHRGSKGGFFALLLQPPERPAVEDITPKELVFVLDTSGSMSGFPLDKAKETMRLALAGLYPQDTFNLITFSGDTRILFPKPVSASPENLRAAMSFMEGQRGGGGTEMMKAIRAALEPSGEAGRVRIVCFMTDGFVGNDMEIVAEVRRNPGARVFSFGIGSSVNRFLLDAMAREGRGEVEYVGLNDNGSDAARRFHERVRQPLLIDIQIDFNGLPVADVHPGRLPDLFAAKPLIITGRFTSPARGAIQLAGRQGQHPFSRTIAVDFPSWQPQHEALASLWARGRVEDLSAQDMAGIQNGSMRGDLREEITRIGIEYRIMTPFTSFIAVEERTVTEGGTPRRVEVPVEMPEGVSHEGVFGREKKSAQSLPSAAAPRQAGNSVVGGIVGGVIGGVLPAREVSASRDERTRSDASLQADKDAQSRMHPQILAWIEEYRAGRRTGMVEIEILLADSTAQARVRIRQLGFQPTKTTDETRRLVGRIGVDKLEALIRLSEVLYVAPVVAR